MADRAPQAETARKREELAKLTGREGVGWGARSMPLDLLVHRTHEREESETDE